MPFFCRRIWVEVDLGLHNPDPASKILVPIAVGQSGLGLLDILPLERAVEKKLEELRVELENNPPRGWDKV